MAAIRKTRSRTRVTPTVEATKRTPVLEWIAAAYGLIMTLSLIGYLIWEGVTTKHAPPALVASIGSAVRNDSGYVLPIILRNITDETAADVEVRGVLQRSNGAPEERHATFRYVPAKGAAHGGLVFQNDPDDGRLTLSVEGYVEP